jgi:hypothetical protein
MSNEEIVPVRHTTMSAFGTKATEAVGGGIRTGAKTALYWIAGFAAVGAVLGAVIATGGFAALGAGSGVLLSALGTGLVGGLIGVATVGFPALLGGLFGAGRGFQEGRQRVNMERGAAQMMDMDFANAQMQLIAAAQQPRQTGTAAPGSRYIQAAPTVDAGSLARDGLLAGQPQLQRA